jgi:hypothetical protein
MDRGDRQLYRQTWQIAPSTEVIKQLHDPGNPTHKPDPEIRALGRPKTLLHTSQIQGFGPRPNEDTPTHKPDPRFRPLAERRHSYT